MPIPRETKRGIGSFDRDMTHHELAIGQRDPIAYSEAPRCIFDGVRRN
eukprot:gene26202-biopygen14872